MYGRLGESLPVLMRDLRPRRLLVNWDKAAGMEEVCHCALCPWGGVGGVGG